MRPPAVAAAVRVRVRAGGLFGRLVQTLIFAGFLGIGCWFTWLIAASFARSVAMWTWDEVPCRIESSAMAADPEAGTDDARYRVELRYRYHADGRDWTGDRYRGVGGFSTSDVGEAQRLVGRHPPGAEARCRVDPGDPAASTLGRPNLFTGLWILFPLVFVAIGGYGIWQRWRPRREDAPGAPPPVHPLSKRLANPGGAGCLAAFFSVFLVAGLGFFIPFFALPAWRTWEARSWPEVPCTLLESGVRSHEGDDGYTYSVEVLYRYRVEGREYLGSRYDFLPGSTSGYESKAEAAARHPVGSTATCRVDPEEPTEVALEPGFHGEFLFGLLPLVFVAAGAGGIAFAWAGAGRGGGRGKRRRRRQWWRRPAGRRRDPAPEIAAGPVLLGAGSGPLGSFVGVLLIAGFWNGIVSVFVWQLIQSWRAGAAEGCLALFLVPFVLVGLLLLSAIPYQFLALFNPRPVLTLAGGGELRLGEPNALEWRIRGLPGRIRRLTLTVRGREKVTLESGKSTRSDERTFWSRDLVDTGDRGRIASGRVELELPADSMHSFSAPHNEIAWDLRLSGEIPFWPDVTYQVPLEVLPAPPGPGGRR